MPDGVRGCCVLGAHKEDKSASVCYYTCIVWRFFEEIIKNTNHLRILGNILSEDSIRNYLKTHTLDQIEGIYKSVFGAFNKCSIIKKAEGQYSMVILESDVVNWYPGGVIATLDYANNNMYALTGLVDKGSFDIKINGIAQYKDGILKYWIDEKNEITFLKIFPTSEIISSDNTTKMNYSEKWSGSGFALNGNYIVTNNHVINDAKVINVYGIRGDFTKFYKAIVAGTDKINDIALLKIVSNDFLGFENIPYSIKTNSAETGEDVFVLGYPLTQIMGNEIKITNGIVSSKSGFDGNVNNYQISAPVQPGNSGGPMFDKKGNIIGIIVAGLKNDVAQNANYAIKTSCLKNLIESVSDSSILPLGNHSLDNLQLSEQIKRIKDYVFYIECYR